MKPNSTEIIFVVDRSGSMNTIAKDMIGGFASFIAEQKKLPGECKVTLAYFDHEYEQAYQGLPLANVSTLALIPRGNTALLDAIGRTIVLTGERLAKLPENQRPSQVLFMIITDGHENASTEFNRDAIHKMIKHQTEVYNWTFLFLGAGLDAIAVAQSYGIMSMNAAAYSANDKGANAVFASTSKVASSLRSQGVRGDIVMQVDINEEEAK
jgi:hypothetical protein